jgi:hypothetical protein
MTTTDQLFAKLSVGLLAAGTLAIGWQVRQDILTPAVTHPPSWGGSRLSSDLAEGDHLSINFDFSADRTIVLAIQRGCAYCAMSMPFYRQLAEVVKSHSRLRFIAITPDDTPFHDVYDFASDGSISKTRLVVGDDVPGSVSKGQPITQHFLDLAREREVVVNHQVKATTTTYLHQMPSRPNSSCDVEPDAPRKTILGYEVRFKQETVIKNSGTTIRVEQWLAPKLNCFSLYETQYYSRTGRPELAATIKIVTSISPGEPKRSLFHVPEGYVEMKPSEVFEATRRLYRADVKSNSDSAHGHPSTDKSIEAMDESYSFRQRKTTVDHGRGHSFADSDRPESGELHE